MAHYREGGIGNMPGSDDRPLPEILKAFAAHVDDDGLARIDPFILIRAASELEKKAS